MDARQQRGLMIAATAKIQKKHGVWVVPSQTGNGRYSVVPHEKELRCTRPDADLGHKCKHVFAVEYVIQRELFDDGTVKETRSVTVTETRTTYPQPSWAAYNAAQVNEGRLFQTLLADLCRTLPAPEPKPGRPKTKPSDSAFAAIYKVYSTMSARRFASDLQAAKEDGHLSKVPGFNTVLDWFDTDEATEILERFVGMSAQPLAEIETDFAVDSTGFSGGRYLQWIDEKYGTPKREVQWVKAHAVVGVKTNCIAAVKVMAKNTSDGAQLPDLVKATAERFTVREVSADKAYTWHSNFNAVVAVGGTFYPAFKCNAKANDGRGGPYAKAFHLMQLNREEYDRHYHKRSNCESTFSAVKRTLGADLRSKTDRAMKNECIAKCVAFNIVCVIHAMYEMGVNPEMGCTNTREVARQPKVKG